MKIYRIILPVWSLCALMPVQADIHFEESTHVAGIGHSGATYGASWGDFDNDGWPDLWVGNHNSKPSLYLNKRDGTFVDIVDKVWAANPRADTHGAAWADFDNDGDQDLVEAVGALENEDGTLCLGCGRNHLFINQNGSLVEKAKAFNLDNTGFGRSPLWFDANRDGKLDLLVANTRNSGQPPSLLFQQQLDRFKQSNDVFEFRDAPWSRRDRLRALLYFRLNTPAMLNMRKHFEFAQLADLHGDQYPELVLFSSPVRVYSINDSPFEEVTAGIELPAVEDINDAVIEDFDGDGKFDMYLARGAWLPSDVIQVNESHIKGTLTGLAGSDPKALFFRTEGALDIQIHPTWLSLSKVFIGAAGRHPENRSFSLSPDDSGVAGPESRDAVGHGGVSIFYDSESRVWTLRNSLKGEYVDFIIHSTKPIHDQRTSGFNPFQEEGIDVLLMRRENDQYVLKQLPGKAGAHTSCFSVVAGDFDNDMDIDLYLVCTGPVENLPNRLLENDGKGNFRLVPGVGGAAGSRLGRGDVAATADYDGDGFLDLFITNGADPAGPYVEQGPHQLFRNLGNDNHWLEIDLEGVKSNRDGIGASLTLEAGGVKQIREQRGGMHRVTQNHQRLHFGLGKNTKVDHITVYWPSGIVQEIKNVAVDQILKIHEEAGVTLTAITAK